MRPGDVAGAVGDLGVFVPLVAALVLVNGLDAGAVLVAAGLLVIASGLTFGVPFPVQPLKALTAVAVARQLGPDVIHAAGLLIALVLLALSVRGVADVLTRVFTRPVVRALQFGVGVLLVRSAFALVLRPPDVFHAVPASPWPLLLALGVLAATAWASRRGAPLLALGVLAAGSVGAVVIAFAAGAPVPAPRLHLPRLGLPPASAFASAFVLLVIPQVPLTFGNAVVAVTDVAGQYFGPRAARVTPARVCRSAGVGNLAAALLGAMPMCHGSAGLTAHYRLGARTAGMNVLLGSAFLALGLWFAPYATALLGLLPVWVLAAFLAYAGGAHALLVRDLSWPGRAAAISAGLLGAVLGNLAVTTLVALAGDRVLAFARRRAQAAVVT